MCKGMGKRKSNVKVVAWFFLLRLIIIIYVIIEVFYFLIQYTQKTTVTCANEQTNMYIEENVL
jgi:hypothetical protein